MSFLVKSQRQLLFMVVVGAEVASGVIDGTGEAGGVRLVFREDEESSAVDIRGLRGHLRSG